MREVDKQGGWGWARLGCWMSLDWDDYRAKMGAGPTWIYFES